MQQRKKGKQLHVMHLLVKLCSIPHLSMHTLVHSFLSLRVAMSVVCSSGESRLIDEKVGDASSSS